MPYIGRNHIAGDHTSNFKVLDDISSYTATFDGSATAVVSTSDETLRIPQHRFIQGQRVTYNNGGGSNIGGLTSGTAYFVTFDTANTIKLATTLANANSNTNINLSSVGGGTSHTLNAAFDGTNTKFKLTHNTGDSARLNNATQLQVAINNVLQRPNNNSNTFTEGYAIESGNKIVFKTAPTVNDVFWGSIIANTIETFDLTDHTIDNFTGDGSTTTFTLSKDVPNIQSLLVTLDGVTQHSSDISTARSYSLVTSNAILFTSAPGNGVEIQVKHLGFAGASTGGVSGFYGRTGNVTLTSSDHITTGDIASRNINSSGIVTASSFSGGFSGNIVGTSATFTGNLSVGGVLTYEDVTNVDSVGIITAQKDIHVGAGVSAVGVGTFGSLDIGGDIDVDGHTNLDNVSIAGITTYSKSGSALRFNDGSILRLGNADSDFFLYHDGNNIDYISAGATKQLRLTTDDFIIKGANNTETLMTAAKDGAVHLYHNNISRLSTSSVGVSISQDLDVDGHTNLDNVSIAGVTTFSTSPIATNGTYYKGIINSGAQPKIIGGYISGSDTLRLGESMYLTTTGLGIGVASPTQKLDVNGSVKATGADINGDLDVDGHTNLDNVSIAGVVTATSFVGSGANLTGIDGGVAGINTTGQSHLKLLNVNAGVVTFTNTSNPTPSATLPSGTGGHLYSFDNALNIVGGAGAGAGGLVFHEGGFTRWRISSGALHPHGTTYNNLGNSSNRVGNAYIQTSVDLVDSAELRLGNSDDFKIYHSTDNYIKSVGSSQNLIFDVNSGERARINSSGFVGINSATPRTYLQVSKGTSHYNPGNPTAFNSANVLACFENNDDVEVTLLSPINKKNIINFGDTDNVANSSIEYDHSLNHLIFKVNGGSERFRINNSGAFGLAGTNYGTSGQVLKSGGTNGVPTWGDASSGGVETYALAVFGSVYDTNSGYILHNITTGYSNNITVDTSNEKLTPTVSGTYLIIYNAHWLGLHSSGTTYYNRITKNGSEIMSSNFSAYDAGSHMHTVLTTTSMNGSSDYIQFEFYENKAGAAAYVSHKSRAIMILLDT